jgi:glutamate-5-semialdehyde dehydrogenase
MSVSNSSPLEVAKAASISSRSLANLSTKDRNDALTAMHDALLQGRESILAANARDLQAANKAAADGSLSQSVLKRLDLGTKGKFDDMLKGILDVRGLEDPGMLSSLDGLYSKLTASTRGPVEDYTTQDSNRRWILML